MSMHDLEQSSTRRSVNRRGFLRVAAALIATGAAGSLAAACSQPAPAAKPTEAPKAAPAAAPAAKPAAPAAAAAPVPTAQPAAPATPVPAAKASPVAASRTPAGELKIALPAKLTTLDPHGAQSVDVTTHTAVQHIFDTLTSRDPRTGNILPRLATSWQAPDPKTWEFTLRPGVKFHDGSPVTSADVKASIERVVELKGPVAPLWTNVESIETPSEGVVRIKTKEPVGTLLANTILLPILPAKARQDGFFSKPVGSGPFKYVSWSPDADLKIEANTEYWGGAPASKELTFRFIPEIAARMTALETGEIDFTWRIPPDQIPALQRAADVTLQPVETFQYYFLWMNSSREPFTDKKVRQAMAHALDVDTMLKDLLEGIGTRATAPIPKSVFGHAPQTPYAYDPNKAKQLLAEAGKPNGFETGVIWYAGAGPQDRELLQAMISQWNAIGVRVRLQEQERATWLDNLIKLNWDMDFQTNSVTTGDADFTLNRLYNSKANRNGYKNPELDQILEKAAASLNQDERKQLYAQANKIIWEDAPGIFPFDLLETYGFRKSVSGVVPAPSGIQYFFDTKKA